MKKQVISLLNHRSNLCNPDKGVSTISQEEQGCPLLLCNSPRPHPTRTQSLIHFLFGEAFYSSQSWRALERRDRETALDMVHLCQHWNIKGDDALPTFGQKGTTVSSVGPVCCGNQPRLTLPDLGRWESGWKQVKPAEGIWKNYFFWNVLLPLTVGINFKDTMQYNICYFHAKK